MKSAAVAVVFFAAVLSLGSCQINPDAYPFSAVLSANQNGDPIYTLYWNFTVPDETIRFAVNVATDGWVGLGISPNGGMTNSDVAVGWVNDNGEAFFHVRPYCFRGMTRYRSIQGVVNQSDYNFCLTSYLLMVPLSHL